MKKIIKELLISLLLVASFAVPTFAKTGEEDTDITSVYLKMTYKLANADTTNPAEEFSFVITPESVSNAGTYADGTKVTKSNMPTLDRSVSISYAEGEATVAGKTKGADVLLPEFTAVGEYKYKVDIVDGDTLTVDYSDNAYLLVIVENGVTEGSFVKKVYFYDETNKKTDSLGVESTYSAGTLNVTKTVTGSMGDKNAYFDVDVTLTSTAAVDSTITISGGSNTSNPTTIVPSDWNNNSVTKTIKVKSGDTVSFTNIPYTVTASVAEKDYSTDGYTTSYDADGNLTIETASVTRTITNTKGSTIDTGVFVDNMPYIIGLAVVATGFVLYSISRRKKESE